jgi:hypothetical protein
LQQVALLQQHPGEMTTQVADAVRAMKLGQLLRMQIRSSAFGP